jgi:hypothetical protein
MSKTFARSKSYGLRRLATRAEPNIRRRVQANQELLLRARRQYRAVCRARMGTTR